MGCAFASIVSRQEPVGHPWLDPETCVMNFQGIPERETKLSLGLTYSRGCDNTEPNKIRRK